MQRHSRDHVVQQRKRYIARRLKLARFVLFGKRLIDGYAEWAGKHAGKLSKWNLVCSCRMCRDAKYRDKRAAEKRRWRCFAGDVLCKEERLVDR